MQNDNVDPPATMAQRHAYFYKTDNDRYFFVSYLGMGAQGCACLVRSVSTGKLYVRKSAYVSEDGDPQKEWKNAMYFHANIPRLVDRSSHPAPPCVVFSEPTTVQPLPMLVTYWEYKNGGDLGKVFNKYESLGMKVPEILLLKLTDQLLKVTTHLRTNRVVQADLLPCNIYLDWPENARLPEFSLGDYGRSKSHLLGELGGYDVLAESTDPLFVKVCQRLLRRDVKLYTAELHSIAAILCHAMFDPVTNNPRPYSRELFGLYESLAKTPDYSKGEHDNPSALDKLNEYVTLLSNNAALLLELQVVRLDHPDARFLNLNLNIELDVIRPTVDAELLDIITFPDFLTMAGYPYSPPGPWNFAIVDDNSNWVDWLPAPSAYRYSPFITGPGNRMLLREDAREVMYSGLAQL